MIDDNGTDVQRAALSIATNAHLRCSCGRITWWGGGIMYEWGHSLLVCCDCGKRFTVLRQRRTPPIKGEAVDERGEYRLPPTKAAAIIDFLSSLLRKSDNDNGSTS